MLSRNKNIVMGIVISLLPMSVYAGNGSVIFQEKCAACHGATGTAVLPGAPNFARGERMEKTNSKLKTTITNGLNAMPPFKGVLSDGQMSEVLAFIRTLKK